MILITKRCVLELIHTCSDVLSYEPLLLREHAVGQFFFFFWFVRLLALRPLLAYCASLG
jgi:hypothetical protein